MFGENPMFGHVEIGIDNKGRISLPVFTKSEANEEVILIEKDDYIEIWPVTEFAKRVERLNDLAFYELDSKKKAEYQEMSDKITAFLKNNHVEKDGRRIALGKDLVVKYNFLKSVYVEGKQNHIRIWEPNKFLEYKTNLDERNKGSR